MSVADANTPSSEPSDWMLELIIGVIVVVLGASVWAYTHFSDRSATPDKPKPAWLAVSKVMAQMGDGRMVNIKVNLRVADDDAVSVLDPHMPAFRALIQETGAQLSREQLQGTEGMRGFSKAIRGALNDYLRDRDIPQRVKDVAFEELMLMP